MTYKEALKWFKDDLKDGKCSEDCPDCNAREKAIEALKKEIPQEPITIVMQIDGNECEAKICPSCYYTYKIGKARGSV